MEIAGKVAVITGGASGIGRGIGRALAKRGADVVVADVDAARAAEVAAELTECSPARPRLRREGELRRRPASRDAAATRD